MQVAAAIASNATGNLLLPVSFLDSNGQLASSTYTVPVTGPGDGSAPGLSLFPAAAAFAPAPVNQLGQVRQIKLTNTGSQPESIALRVPASFPLAAPPSCHTLPAGASCTVTVAFVPQTAGLLQQSLLVTATSADGLTTVQASASLSGYAPSATTLATSGGALPSAPIAFGSLASGQTTTQTVTLTNTGPSPLHLRRLSTSAPFTAATTCTAPLAPQAACTVTLTYAPSYTLPADALQTPRDDTGSLLIDSDAGTAPLTLFLQGTAQPSPNPAPSGSLPALTLSQGALTFANTLGGSTSASQQLILTNTGAVPVDISALLVPPGFAATSGCSTLPPAASCALQVAFTPTDASPSFTVESLGILSTAATVLDSVTLVGSTFASPLATNPPTLDFGPVPLGSSRQLSLQLTNQTILPLALEQLTATGDFALDLSSCQRDGAPLAAGQSCSVTLTFTPTARGLRSGTFASTGTNSPPVPLTGFGTLGTLAVTPAALDFGPVPLGSARTLSLQLSNSGDAPLGGLVPALTGADAANFSLRTTCPATLDPGSTCAVEITFTPALLGSRSATLQLASSDPAGPLPVALTGTGSDPPGITLDLAPGSPATAAITRGNAAHYSLILAAQGGFTGPVALTCTAIPPAPEATCALSNTVADLHADPLQIGVTLSTRSDLSSDLSAAALSPWALLLAAPLGLLACKRSSPSLHCRLLFAFLLGAALTSLNGCGGGYAAPGSASTPARTSQYQVTATATTQPALTSSVTLQLTVR